MDQIKDRLKEWRNQKGLKQRDVAEALNVNVGLVGSWECGRQKVPDYRIDQICTKFGVSRDWLERGEGEMFVEPDHDKIFRDQIVAMYEGMPSEYRELWYKCAKAIVESKSTAEACGKIDDELGRSTAYNNTVEKNYGTINYDQKNG